MLVGVQVSSVQGGVGVGDAVAVAVGVAVAVSVGVGDGVGVLQFGVGFVQPVIVQVIFEPSVTGALQENWVKAVPVSLCTPMVAEELPLFIVA